MKNVRSITHALVGALAVLVALQGCGDDSDGNEKPPTDVTPTAGTKSGGGTGGKSGNDTGGAHDGGTGTGTGNTGNTGTGNTGNTGTGNTGNTGTGGEAGGGSVVPEPECNLPERGENGCYNCPEDGEQEQWFNRCTEGDCVDFDDTKLEKLDGDITKELPPLPN